MSQAINSAKNLKVENLNFCLTPNFFWLSAKLWKKYHMFLSFYQFAFAIQNVHLSDVLLLWKIHRLTSILIPREPEFSGKPRERSLSSIIISQFSALKILSLQAMNLVDFLAILPYFISLGLESLEDLHILGKAGKIMRLVRVMRILRIFKLVRHFAGLQSLLYTLKQVWKLKWKANTYK